MHTASEPCFAKLPTIHLFQIRATTVFNPKLDSVKMNTRNQFLYSKRILTIITSLNKLVK